MFTKVLRALAGQERKAAPTAATTGRRGPACTRCKGSLPVGARRCSRCGTRVTTAETAETTVTAPPRSIRPIEAAILRGALAGGAGSPPVFVTPSQGAVVGEIKVGGERIFGDEAVRAVATLVADGNLAPHEDGFALTAVGRLRAQKVSA